jgi:hypothetical protein
MDGQTQAKYVKAQSTDLNGSLVELTLRQSELDFKSDAPEAPDMFKLSFTIPLEHGDYDGVIPNTYTCLNKSKVTSGH